jgi:hypothetical protein
VAVPDSVSITGTWLLRTTASIRPAPPRGSARRPSRARPSAQVTSRGPGTSWIARPAARHRAVPPAAPRRWPRWTRLLKRNLRQCGVAGLGAIPPASAVTGRALDDADHAEWHLIWRICIPFGLVQPRMMSPTGSGRAARSRNPSTMPASRSQSVAAGR